jgi:hypothetical protein
VKTLSIVRYADGISHIRICWTLFSPFLSLALSLSMYILLFTKSQSNRKKWTKREIFFDWSAISDYHQAQKTTDEALKHRLLEKAIHNFEISRLKSFYHEGNSLCIVLFCFES